MHYDEFAYFADNATEVGLRYDGPPVVRRASVALADGRQLSALVWGDGEPELVLIHGGAQNAHTWDTVALALDRSLVAIDLPGHGHSDAPSDITREGRVAAMAADVAEVIRAIAANAKLVVGMSLGGMTSIALATHAPDLVRRLALIDITPGVNGVKAKAITDFVRGPATFASFDDLLARTIQHNPTRTESSLRRGILHNAEQLEDGSWQWRYRRHDAPVIEDQVDEPSEAEQAAAQVRGWNALGAITVPVMLVRGMRPQSVVDDADEEELRRRLPSARIEHIDAGHSVQGDRPVELAALIASFADA